MTNAELAEAKDALDKIIRKSRVHFYKPIQIAEILFRHRKGLITDLLDVESYRSPSKRWRDDISSLLVGRASTSSSVYQDNLFNENAIPPRILKILGDENISNNGAVEAYIYKKFNLKQSQLSGALDYCLIKDRKSFNLAEFLDLFWIEPGLRRSIDKVYEIVVYALFSALVKNLGIHVEISIKNGESEILKEFEEFTEKIINLNTKNLKISFPAKIYRVGVTNAADRGLDMWANFGLAIQIKHLSLTEELAENIVSAVSADRIVIVCKEAERGTIISLLTQIGWKSKIQSIITESDLSKWYEKALRGEHSEDLADNVISQIIDQLSHEFPSSDNHELLAMNVSRGYDHISDSYWN